MKAIILAAGRGSRMKALTDEKPKCLVQVNGITLLDRQISALKQAGISDIAIVTGYKREMLEEFGLKEFFNSRWAETNMVYSLSCAEEWLSAFDCVVSYSDIFYDASAVASLAISFSPIAVTYDPNWLSLWEDRFGDPLLDAESFRVSPTGSLLEIGQKPQSKDDVQGQYMGLLKFRPDGWSNLLSAIHGIAPNIREKMFMTDALQAVIQRQSDYIVALPYNGEWGEVDSESDLALYNNRSS